MKLKKTNPNFFFVKLNQTHISVKIHHTANKSPKSQHNNTKKKFNSYLCKDPNTRQNPTQHRHTQITDQDLLGIGDEDVLGALKGEANGFFSHSVCSGFSAWGSHQI